MRTVLTPQQMAEADRATIAAGTPSLALMQRAGFAVARAALRLAGGSYGRRVLILCGKGNNAGDGLVAARVLAGWGCFPVVVSLDAPASLSGDALANWGRLRGVRHLRFDPDSLGRELARCDLVIDAIVGTGFRGALSGAAAQAVGALNASGRPVLAVDIPSGVDGATGAVGGPAVRATVTVTMAAAKFGLILHPGSEYAGRVEVADIGIATPQPPEAGGIPEAADVARALGRRPLDAHKRSVGTVMVVAGSAQMPGAAGLAIRAALRAGAGLVTLATVASVAEEVHPGAFEATTLHLPATAAGTIARVALQAILDRAATVDAVAVGPGLTTQPETAELVRALAAALDVPLVVDADGLNALAADPGILAGRTAPTIITPHPGEASRLLGISSSAVQADRLQAAAMLAARCNAEVILKGYRSIVASPGGRLGVVTTGGPALASGGTGDVLTGVTVALLAAMSVPAGRSGAQGAARDPYPAAWAASWIHGRAGDLLGQRYGVRGVLAGDLPAAVAGVLHDLEGQA